MRLMEDAAGSGAACGGPTVAYEKRAKPGQEVCSFAHADIRISRAGHMEKEQNRDRRFEECSWESGKAQTARAFPTDERLRQKAKLKAGHVPKARKQEVEDHHDDCGTDLSGLAPYLLGSVSSVGDGTPVDYDDDDLVSSITDASRYGARPLRSVPQSS